MDRFHGMLVLVTGGAGGLGAETARQLVRDGARVFITDLREEEGEALARELGEAARFFRHDVSREAEWEALAGPVREAGGLGGLVNNAGIFDPRPIGETSAELFERHVSVNQTGAFLGLKFAGEAAAPGGASVVNVSSLAGLRGPKGVAYVATKWALRGMTKTAALEFAPKRIRVNSIHPALIETPMLGIWSERQFEERRAMVPLGRAGTADDVARLILFLLSEDSGFITGAEIAIDGGLSL